MLPGSFTATCTNLTTLGGYLITWAGICVFSAFTFQALAFLIVVLTTVKLVFIAFFDLLEVILHLLSSKCMPVVLYGLESCPTHVTKLLSLEHPVTMALIKNLITNSIDIVSYCQSEIYLSFRARIKYSDVQLFFVKLSHCQNSLCSCSSANRVSGKNYHCCAHSSVS